MSRVPRAFYDRPTLDVVHDTLGKVLVHATEEGRLAGRIVEVEAYRGIIDPGSHAFRGPTARNAVMFGPPGYAYVYLSYGVHVCLNLVTEPEGTAGAILLRALQPLEGIEIMQRNRRRTALKDLCSGPGKLCQALEISLRDYGADLEDSSLWLEDDGTEPREICSGPRIGLSQGTELPWRFWIAGSPYVSR